MSVYDTIFSIPKSKTEKTLHCAELLVLAHDTDFHVISINEAIKKLIRRCHPINEWNKIIEPIHKFCRFTPTSYHDEYIYSVDFIVTLAEYFIEGEHGRMNKDIFHDPFEKDYKKDLKN
jgi:hypothetical protein